MLHHASSCLGVSVHAHTAVGMRSHENRTEEGGGTIAACALIFDVSSLGCFVYMRTTNVGMRSHEIVYMRTTHVGMRSHENRTEEGCRSIAACAMIFDVSPLGCFVYMRTARAGMRSHESRTEEGCRRIAVCAMIYDASSCLGCFRTCAHAACWHEKLAHTRTRPRVFSSAGVMCRSDETSVRNMLRVRSSCAVASVTLHVRVCLHVHPRFP